MTNAQPAIAAPGFAYFLGRTPPEERGRVLAEIADGTVEHFETMMQGAIDGLALERAEPLPRLQAYLEKPTADWQQQYLVFPGDFEVDWQDFEGLRVRALRGDFDARNPEIRALVTAWELTQGGVGTL